MAVGSLVQAIHSVEGSIAPAGRWARLHHRLSEFEDGELCGRRTSACRRRALPGFMSDRHVERLNETARDLGAPFAEQTREHSKGGVALAAPAAVAQRMVLSGEDLSAGTVQWGNRAGSATPVALTDRDLRLMALTHDVNFLSASQLVVLGWGTRASEPDRGG